MTCATRGWSTDEEVPGARLRDRLRPALDSELTEDAVGVGLDCACGDEQPGGNFPVRQTRGNQPQHLAFPRGERVDQDSVAIPGRWLEHRQQPSRVAHQSV